MVESYSNRRLCYARLTCQSLFISSVRSSLSWVIWLRGAQNIPNTDLGGNKFVPRIGTQNEFVDLPKSVLGVFFDQITYSQPHSYPKYEVVSKDPFKERPLRHLIRSCVFSESVYSKSVFSESVFFKSVFFESVFSKSVFF